MGIDRHTHQNFVVDGLLEMVLGASLLLIALAISLSAIYTSVFPPLFFFLLSLGIPFLFQRMLAFEKRLHPQTDYTEPYHPQHVVRYVLLALFFFLIPSLFIFLQPAPSAARGLVLVMGGLFAAVLLWVGLGLVRFTSLAIASILLSVGLTWFQVESPLSYIIFCSIFGFMILVSGIVTFIQYSRRET